RVPCRSKPYDSRQRLPVTANRPGGSPSVSGLETADQSAPADRGLGHLSREPFTPSVRCPRATLLADEARRVCRVVRQRGAELLLAPLRRRLTSPCRAGIAACGPPRSPS